MTVYSDIRHPLIISLFSNLAKMPKIKCLMRVSCDNLLSFENVRDNGRTATADILCHADSSVSHLGSVRFTP
jgi:hypothetical protein